MNDQIIIKGARQHNLKNIDLTIPRDKLVVFTGISGSGKSSLAFDTIYAEGQRRYVESLSSYARMFLGQMEKPDVDSIEGLSPAISIDQKTTSRNPRSTVGTVTEVHDYLRLLYARIGQPHCPQCGRPIAQQSVDQMVEAVLGLDEGTRVLVLAPIVRERKGEHAKLFEDLRKGGYARVMVDGELHDLTDEFRLPKNNKHSISAVVDRIVVNRDARGRIGESIETSLDLSSGLVVIKNADTGEEMMLSGNYACPDCGISMEELTPRMFSFNNPFRPHARMFRPRYADENRPGSGHSRPVAFAAAGRHSRFGLGQRVGRQHGGHVFFCVEQALRIFTRYACGSVG